MAKRTQKPADPQPESQVIPTDNGVPLLAGDAPVATLPAADIISEGTEPAIEAATSEEDAPVIDPVRIVKLDLPLLQTPDSLYAPRTLRELDRRHAKILREITSGLAHEGAKVDGKPVRTPDQALAWLLDQCMEKAE